MANGQTSQTPQTWTSDQIRQAYQALYGVDPYPLMGTQYPQQFGQTSPVGVTNNPSMPSMPTMPAATLMALYQAQQAQKQQQQAAQQAGAQGGSYLGGASGAAGGTTGAGGTTSAVGGTMASTTASGIATGANVWGGSADPANIAEWQQWYGANVGNTILVNGQPRTIEGDINADQLYQAFQQGQVGFGNYQAAGPQQPAGQIGATVQPETVALGQMAQVDPVTEALRQQLASSYLTNLQQGPTAPSAADVQSYLNTYQQIDPTGYAARQQLESALAQQSALGTQLDPETAREIDQATLQAQTARGNVYGTPQLVQQAMTRGEAGLALQQQRQQALQSYLTSGASIGDIANSLYNQGYSRYLQGQQAALGYLGSGQTPLAAATGYINNAQNQAAAAAQGGPAYNPQQLSSYYTGTGVSSYPQYGLDISQLAGNYYNNMNQANLQAYGLQQAYSQQGGGQGGAIGGGIGTALGSVVGSIVPGVGTAIGGAIGGALGGAAGSYIK